MWLSTFGQWNFYHFNATEKGIFILGYFLDSGNTGEERLAESMKPSFKWHVTSFLPEGLLYLFRIHKESPPGYFTVWWYAAYFPDRSLLQILRASSTCHMRHSLRLSITSISRNQGFCLGIVRIFKNSEVAR